MPEFKKVIILSHILTTVPAEDLERYFIQQKTQSLFFIGHPLFYRKGRPGSHFRLYKKGKLVSTRTLPNIPYPSFIQYFRDTMLTIFWIMRTRQSWDLIIALDNLNTFAALLLRKIGKIKRVIYYTIDFTPQRFHNKLLNDFYHGLDKFCVEHVDLTWNISPRIAQGREAVRGMEQKKYNKQITTPVGVWLERIRKKRFESIEKHTLVYAGGLSPHQGIQLVLDAIPIVAKKISDFKFIVIGMGDYEDTLKKKAKKLKIEKYVNFLGYMEKHEDVEKILSNCAVAIAMYSHELSKWSYYADPSKIKTYLATGLPVITTSLTYIASELEEKQCGIVVKYNKNSVAQEIISLMTDTQKLKKYKKNAYTFASHFDWNTIFAKGIEKLHD